jgi:methyl-accepting chemotaxis protein
MNWFYNLRIAKKLVLTFSVVIAMALAMGVFAIVQLQQVNQASSDISTNWLPSIRVLSQIQLSLTRLRNIEAQHILMPDARGAADIAKMSDGLIETLAAQEKRYVSLISEPTEKILYKEVDAVLTRFLADHRKILDLSAAGDKAAASELERGAGIVTFQAALASVDKAVQINDAGAEHADATADVTYASARFWICVLLAATVVASLILALWMARLISSPLRLAVDRAKQIAGGDLTAKIVSDSKDETGELMAALGAMNGALFAIVGDVRAGTDTIATAANQIAAGNLDLSSRTEEQASSLEETAAAMEELTSTVKHNADNARQANQLAGSATHVATEGGVVVGRVVDTMHAINASSKKIVEIISVIDSIAFQTNILALNAAVEAARAGEQGRGFAVVASEVRNLAQRSAAAAKEIKGLIDESVKNVDAGSVLVAQAGSTMNDVVASVKKVTDIVGEISSSSHEQSTGIEQINHAVMQMDQVTQQNAALVEQSAAAAQAMQEQAENLSHAVGFFTLSDTGRMQAPRDAGRAPARLALARG